MLSKKTKDKPMMLTTHRLESLKLAKKIEAIPEDKRTDQQRRSLSNFQTEEKGILTSHDLGEKRLNKSKYQPPESLLTPEELEAVAAFKRKIVEDRAKAPAKKPVDKKISEGKGGQSAKKESKPKTNTGKK